MKLLFLLWGLSVGKHFRKIKQRSSLVDKIQEDERLSSNFKGTTRLEIFENLKNQGRIKGLSKEKWTEEENEASKQRLKLQAEADTYFATLIQSNGYYDGDFSLWYSDYMYDWHVTATDLYTELVYTKFIWESSNPGKIYQIDPHGSRLINETFEYYSELFTTCDRHQTDSVLSYTEVDICNRAINEYRTFEKPMHHNGGLVGDWDHNGKLSKEEFTLNQNVFLTALAITTLRKFDMDYSNYVEPREEEKDVLVKIWSLILDMPEWQVLNTYDESDVILRDGSLDVHELLIFHSNLDTKFIREKMLSDYITGQALKDRLKAEAEAAAQPNEVEATSLQPPAAAFVEADLKTRKKKGCKTGTKKKATSTTKNCKAKDFEISPRKITNSMMGSYTFKTEAKHQRKNRKKKSHQYPYIFMEIYKYVI